MNAVRPRRNVDSHHIGMLHGFLHPAPEIAERRVGICEIQEIGDEFLRLVLRPHMRDAPVKLTGDLHADRLRLIVRSDRSAEDAGRF